jgi:hypothetical protein
LGKTEFRKGKAFLLAARHIKHLPFLHPYHLCSCYTWQSSPPVQRPSPVLCWVSGLSLCLGSLCSHACSALLFSSSFLGDFKHVETSSPA